MENKEFVNLLGKEGWEKVDPGQTRRIDYSYRFDLFIRKRKLCDLVDNKMSNESGDTFKMSPNESGENIEPINTPENMSNTPLGILPSDLTSSASTLPALSQLGDYPSIAAAKKDSPSLVIAFDSEWFYPQDGSGERQMLTWQFAFVWGENLIELIWVRNNRFDLTLETALARILDMLDLPCIKVDSLEVKYLSLAKDPESGETVEQEYSTRAEALETSRVLYDDKRKVHTRHDWSSVQPYPVTLLCHTGLVDVSSLDQSSAYSKDILHYCTDVHHGLVTLCPVIIRPVSLKEVYNQSGHSYKYSISLSVSDTLCHAPAGMRSLKALGHVVGMEKVELVPGVIEHMDTLLEEDPRKYFEYASSDAVITLLYGAALYGYNNKLPVTVTSAACAAMKNNMAEYLGCEHLKDFDHVYRGLEKVVHGMFPARNRDGYIESSSKEAISSDADDVQHMACRAYHGGYNGCIEIGYFPFDTFDYDLCNAYPTAMCLVSDVDWDNPIRADLRNHDLSLQDFTVPLNGGYAPLTMMVAYVHFEFPEDVMFPCIPISDNGILVYPRTSKGLDGVYACGPELYLALRLGAKVFVKHGYILNSLLRNESGEISYALRDGVKQLVADRTLAKKQHGKKSLEELILKTMVNSIYGKTAQNVVQKNAWSALDKEMKDLGCSAITNPVAACMTTSIVRAELLAVMNQCNELGYHVYSVTTDGFISNIPEESLHSLDLYGIKPFIEEARMYLTGGERTVWEIKHRQNDLLNFTTRGNVSLLPGGVCAHNGTKSGYESDSYEDRLWLTKSVLSRTGPVEYKIGEWTSFKDVEKGIPFRETVTRKHVRMDFDLKRKPTRDSFITQKPVIDGTEYEIVSFSSMPFEDISEFRLYREKSKAVNVLRTLKDWERYWSKVDAKGTNMKIRDMDWAILNSCIIGHRAGMWTIPALDTLKGEARNEWINAHNTSRHQFKNNDWSNAGRATRQCNMLPEEMLGEKLKELTKWN